MPQPSLTRSESFQLRILRSEAVRCALMAGVYGAMVLLTLVRRETGGVVMTDNQVFLPYLGVLVAALAYAGVAWALLRRKIRLGRPIARWKLAIGALVELAVPALLLLILHLWSPRGSYAALSAPALLLFPVTILLSVMRLRPLTTLWLGLGAAAVHAALVLDTIRVGGLDASHYPVLLSYALLLVFTGVAGMLVTRAARRYVAEAVDEAEARERAGMKLAAVERDLEVARQIQLGLLPSGPPAFDGFDIAGMNRPADQTGGDYYDWQRMPDGRLLAVVADVTGHGIGPALVMAVCRAYARASAPLDPDPASLMGRLNGLLLTDNIGGRFVTLAMALLQREGVCDLVSAGHGPSFLFRANSRKVEQFGGDGLPLAVVAEETYGPVRRFGMERGDVLVMLTDGMFEWQNEAGQQFGVNRLADALARAADEPASRIVELMHGAVTAHAGRVPQSDDVTIVVIKRVS